MVVLVLAGIGALVGGVTASRSSERYESVAAVSVPGGEAMADLLALARASLPQPGADEELEVEVDGDLLRFVVRTQVAPDAAELANAAAEGFVDLVGEPAVRLSEAAVTPTARATPDTAPSVIAGLGVGALLGLALQGALWGERRGSGRWRAPSRNGAEPLTPTGHQRGDDTAEARAVDAPAEPNAPCPDDHAPGSDDHPDTEGREQELSDGTDPRPSPGVFHAWIAPTEDLVERLQAAGHEPALHEALLEAERSAGRAAQQAGREELVEFEVALEERRDAAEPGRAATDTARQRLEGRAEQPDTDLTSGEAQLRRRTTVNESAAAGQRVCDNDLGPENELLRSEVERYQNLLDGERVAHATALAQSRLENLEQIDQLDREHRTALDRLSRSNRSMLAEQRAGFEAAATQREADHQRELDEAHREYEQRLQTARQHFDERLAAAGTRAGQLQASTHDDELHSVTERLDEARRQARELRGRLDRVVAENTRLEHAGDEAARDLERAQREHAESERRLGERIDTLESRLEEARARAADERRRTGRVVRDVLEESAAVAAEAERARHDLLAEREALEVRHRREIADLVAEARAFERSAGNREALLEARIAALRTRAE